jgi:hypothetical protein
MIRNAHEHIKKFRENEIIQWKGTKSVDMEEQN